MRTLLFILLFVSGLAYAEGTPSLSPSSSNITAILIAPDLGSGSYLNCSPDNRIKFHVKNNVTETIICGFDLRQYGGGSPTRLTNAYYKIYDPAGNVEGAGQWNSVPGETAGNIDSYEQAINGPTWGSVTNGYNPYFFYPNTNGDYWIEFYRSNDGGITPDLSINGRIVANFFDITVTNDSLYPENGRVHCNKWSLLAVSPTFGVLASASSNPVLYAYTDDHSVIRVDFQDGFQPIAYNVAINNYGISQTGTYDESRKSRNDAVAPTLSNGYEVFLNQPDVFVYPGASIPNPPTFQTQAISGSSPFNINYTTEEVGDISVLIDLNGISGYQSETSDVLLEAYNVPAGNNSIVWNGLNGLGVPVTSSLNITLSLKLLKGRFNLPLHDVEVNKNGFNVSIVGPVSVPNMQLFWDDSQLTNIGSICNTGTGANNTTGAGLNMSKQGVQSPGHAWNGDGNINQLVPAPSVSGNDTDLFQCNDFGNVRTINTWGWGIFSTQTNILLNIYTLAVTTPTPYQICDVNNDGTETFDLTSKNSEILGSLSNSEYTVSYYVSLVDSQNNTNPILNPTAFISSSSIVYVRVWENANLSNFALTSINLQLNTIVAIQAPNLIQVDSPYDGQAVFDLSLNNQIINATPGLYTSYYTSVTDAQSGTNIIPNPTAYTNQTNPQTIGVRVTDPVTGCFNTTSFQLIVTDSSNFTINQPTPLYTCDSNYNNGYGIFYLFYKDGEILGTLNPNFYTVSYYSTITDSQNGTNPLPNATAYANSNPFNQTIYVRVFENANPNNFAFTTLNLVVNPLPILNNAPNLTQIDNDGFATFDLSTINSLLGPLNPSDYIFSYYPTITDATNGTNQILDFSNYTNSINPENVTVKVTNNVTGCYQFSGFNLEVQASDFPINTPTTLSVCGNSFGIGEFNLHLKDIEILGSLNPSNYTVTYYANSNDAFNEQNALPFVYNNTTNSSQTIFVRVDENATTNFSTTTLQLYAITPPFIATTVPNMTVSENPFDGVANFDLTQQNYYITTFSTQVINFYTTLTDAENQTNVISNPSSFTGNHLQTIWFSLTEPSTTCSTIGSFTLNVIDSLNTVYIPDANFKSKLIALGIDTNSDGEIQYSEALVPTNLDVSGTYDLNGGITNMIGIEAFTNLTSLVCLYNHLLSIDITQNTSLINFNCSYNELTILDVTQNTNLISLKCSNNELTTIDVSSLPNIEILDCSDNQFTTLNLSSTNNIKELYCSNNQLTSIDVSNLTQIRYLYLSSNLLTSLNLNGLTTLEMLSYSNNNIPNLDVSYLTNLYFLDCVNTQSTQLNVGNLVHLDILSCGNNQYTNLILSSSISILTCESNLLISLDLSNLDDLTTLFCNDNQLTTLLLKNGSNESDLFFSNNPNLSFICADETQITDIQNQLITNGMTNTVVNSYCSFNPGGDYNTITGTVKYDFDNNGCDDNDVVFPNLKMKMTQWGINSATFTNQLGNYTFYTTFADQLVEPQIENPSFFNFSPQDASISFPDNNNNVFTQNFCLSPNGTHNDLEVSIMPVTPARPGFDATYKIVYKNKGNQTMSQLYGVNLFFNQNLMQFVSATITPDNIGPGGLSWNYTNLLPFESRSIEVTFTINTPTATNPVNIDDVLQFTTSILPMAGDELTFDNTLVYNQTVVGSFDPNDITCLEGESVSPTEIGKYLHYAVNFENTGTYQAENVVVKDIIDLDKYDIESLQVMNTSHPAYIKITGNVVEFIFQNINLAPRGGNPPVGGHGNVLFKIKSKSSLVVDDFVEKAAKIYFDYNAPIDTNIAQTTFVLLSNSIPVFDDSVTVYPNPTTGNVNINSNFNIKSIELYDIQGRILETSFENSNTIKFDISEKQNGIYFLKVNTENGSKIVKIIKE